jgi:hypothetical protein
MPLPFNITNPGIFIDGVLTSGEQAFVTNLAGFSPSDGDIFVYRSAGTDWVLEAKPGGGGASVSDAAYGGAWNGDTTNGASKNTIYDKIESLAGGHDAVTVTDSAEINFTLTDQDITAILISGSVDETKLDTSVNDSLDLADSATQPGDLAAVATSGAYSDLTGAPTIPTVDDTAYDATSWNANTDAPSKNSVRDKIESLAGGHDAVTVTDSTEINFTLTDQDLTAILIAGSIDETKLDASVNASLDLADAAEPALVAATITGKTEITAVGADYILLSDTSDSGNLKKALISDILGAGGGDLWSDPVDADIIPDTDSTRSMGSATKAFSEIYTDSVRSNSFQTVVGGPSEFSVVSINGTLMYTFSSDDIGASDTPVNRLRFSSATTGAPVRITADGNDTNISLNLITKGTGEAQVNGERIIDESDTNYVKLAAVTATAAELNFVDGVTSNVQTQLGTKVQENTDVTFTDLEITGEFGADAEVDDGNSGTADTIVWTTGNFHKSTMTGACTYTFTNPTYTGRYQLMLVQDGTGSREATWPATVKWPGGTAPTLSTAASAIDIISLYWDGTNYFGVDSLAFA